MFGRGNRRVLEKVSRNDKISFGAIVARASIAAMSEGYRLEIGRTRSERTGA